MMSSCCLTILVLVLSINYWAADGYPACSHTIEGECMSEKQCKASGGVKGSNSDNFRCLNDVQANDGGEDKVYCTTFAHLAKDLCLTWLPQWKKHDPSCGMEIHLRQLEPVEGEFKHHAQVGRWHDGHRNLKWECGGALISPYFVLTAAHCVAPEEEHSVKLGEYAMDVDSSENKEVIKMVLPGYLHRSSEYNQTMKNIKTEQILGVKRVIRHPKYEVYSTNIKIHDVALLELITPVLLNEYVLPACLPFNIEDDPKLGTQLTIAGWGLHLYGKGGFPSTNIKKVNVPVVGGEHCEVFFNAKLRSMETEFTMTANLLCAGKRGLDTCQGDSGGPIGQSVSQTDYPCGAQVLGVSFGSNCGKLGIYTKVSTYLNWIMRYLAPDHYHLHITEQIHSTGLEFDGKSTIHFSINDEIFTNGFQIQLDFKTEDDNGILIEIPREEQSILLRMKDGKVRFSEPLGNVKILTENSYNDGEWHYLTVECSTTSHKCHLKIDGQSMEQPWTPSTLKVDRVVTLKIGGTDEDVNFIEKPNKFYKGCLVYSLSSTLRLGTVHSSSGTVTTCDSSNHEENRDAADRQRLHLEHLNMRKKMVSMQQRLLEMSKIITNVHDIARLQRGDTYHTEDALLSAPNYTGCYPPFIVINSTTECLFFGRVLLTLLEAKTSCQIMGAKLAIPDDLAKLSAYMLNHDLKALYWVDGSDNGESCLQYDPSREGYINSDSCSEGAKARYICKITSQ